MEGIRPRKADRSASASTSMRSSDAMETACIPTRLAFQS
jgi:hypothetical protein